MTYVHSDWPYFLRKNPEVLRERILIAFAENNGNLKAIYKALGISMFKWYTYIEKLGLKERIASMRLALDARHVRAGHRYSPARERSEPVLGPPPMPRRTTSGEIPITVVS